MRPEGLLQHGKPLLPFAGSRSCWQSGDLGCYFKLSAERPCSSSGTEIAPSSPLCENICTALEIIHISPIMIALGPGANSASDLCPYYRYSIYITQRICFLPRLSMYQCCCGQIAAYGHAHHVFVPSTDPRWSSVTLYILLSITA